MESLIMAVSGFIAGILAGFLGIGGGTILVPILVALGYTPLQSVATSSLAIAITAASGTVQNLRMGLLKPTRILTMGIPALLAAQLGVFLAEWFSQQVLLIGFGTLLLFNLYLFNLRKQAIKQQGLGQPQPVIPPMLARGVTGAIAGVLAGLFGVGGGAIMVPLQLLLLGDPLKVAIQTSLGVIVLTAIAATVGHAVQANVMVNAGIILGIGGVLGSQISTRFLPKLPDRWLGLMFRTLLLCLASYTFWRAWIYSMS